MKLQQFYENVNQQLDSVHSEIGHFNIFKVEDMMLPDNKPVTYSRRSFYKVSLVNGHSKIHYADHTIETNGTVLVFTNPLIPFFWERISEKHTGFVCIFTEDFFSRSGNLKDYPVFQSADAAVIPLNKKETIRFQRQFEKMFKELQGDYAFKYDLLRNLLLEITHDAQKMQPAQHSPYAASNASERITGLFAELLERQFPIELSSQILQLSTPAGFAKQLNIHVNHLNKALKEITGQTTSQLIQERIAKEAKILLKSTSWSIADIAWSLGFEEANHFSSFFKTKTGQTPRNFRSSLP
ncbi:helix-turn-helix domain-containing protein [Taibaiella soli]|nr:helix-turn-helix transcriptional regulator [Taibaiella soli]